MRTRTIIAIIIAAGLFHGCATPRETSDSQNAIQVTYEVFGMDCPGCHGGLEKNLLKIPGVHSAKANWKKKTVTLTYDRSRSLDIDKVRQAVKNSNFTIGKEVK